jgi:hypothetical protein
VVVVIHQTPGVAKPVELRDDLLQCLQKRPTILIVFKNIFPPITTCGDVIKGVREFYADRARHGGS